MNKFDDRTYFFNRELSWLAFNERVLAEAERRENPLFERLKFLSITASNLDEFFMVRVAGLKDQVKIGYAQPDNKTQMKPAEQLARIARQAHVQVKRMYEVYRDVLVPALSREGIRFRTPARLTRRQRAVVTDYFHRHVFPVLTPLAVDASHPFPLLANKGLNIAALLKVDASAQVSAAVDPLEAEDDLLYAVVPVPSVLPRCVEVPTAGGLTYVLLEEVIRAHLEALFPGHEVLESACFRITRNGDISVDEEHAEDLLEEIEKELKKRQRGDEVRLEVSHRMGRGLLAFLKDRLELSKDDIYWISGPIDLTYLSRFDALPGFDHLRFPPQLPQPPRDLIGEMEIFDAIKHKDILVFHPYESFEPVVHLVRQAADDPDVLAIKQTLYRVGRDSPVVEALARAAENGKQVTVLFELKARFDEENNIVWAKKLEEAGCHVIYGLVGLKTHSKITLVVRREGAELRRYVHLSTGNYNQATARLYTDIGLFTANEAFGYDASEFFNHLTGYGMTPSWRQIVTAPHGLKSAFLQFIRNEIEKTTPEHPGRIIAKMNSLTDKDIIMALYEASLAGVQIDLLVRGICCLRPGLPGVSENIRVSSIVGRFLEHSRIFYFRNGGEERFYLSSADWMTRNMINRVEILFPVLQHNLQERLRHILEIQLADNVNRYRLRSDGVYEMVVEEGKTLSSQQYFYEEAHQCAQERTAEGPRPLIPVTVV
ncbi:RNA degradosome polyphosphate kinase [Alicyclobacillus cycloheptanicus]|uniref:Polyphosphate kinase n=2 Tax=Alicyclobacillus cycloheptanicus TaxID=1457 RepID=A0ABT9XD28_9BACL|nr:RNA degradosome polyphosphate kinase [Alicyclobacillus cycloheptanicus]MDQ0188201.1 polyphosphate kinase [Alicyclobacillus cycloheptanicus]WDM00932.1 RNA degradosome polyphosphate kinase [Alicyclobacillus cycloheptanicus]